MNVLPTAKRVLILTLLSEGNSIRAISRITGASKNTIKRLLLDSGQKAYEIHNRQMVNLNVKYLQVDEIWTFVAKKQAQLKKDELDNPNLGDQYVFVALDADTKLVPAYRVGKRTGKIATSFMVELSTRIMSRFQLSTDSFAPYYNAVDRVWGQDIDYGQIHKEYHEDSRGERRYSPANIVRATKRFLLGEPNPHMVSTSHVERQNLTMRMQMRRFTRLTNAFSKKLEYLEAAIALHFFHYNFMRIHQTLRVSPAMEAGITKKLWKWEDFLTYTNA
jgi:IS1 family transposase